MRLLIAVFCLAFSSFMQAQQIGFTAAPALRLPTTLFSVRGSDTTTYSASKLKQQNKPVAGFSLGMVWINSPAERYSNFGYTSSINLTKYRKVYDTLYFVGLNNNTNQVNFVTGYRAASTTMLSAKWDFMLQPESAEFFAITAGFLLGGSVTRHNYRFDGLQSGFPLPFDYQHYNYAKYRATIFGGYGGLSIGGVYEFSKIWLYFRASYNILLPEYDGWDYRDMRSFGELNAGVHIPVW